MRGMASRPIPSRGSFHPRFEATHGRPEHQQSLSSSRWTAPRLIPGAIVLGLLTFPDPASFLPAVFAQLTIEALQTFLLVVGALLCLLPWLQKRPARRSGKRSGQDNISYTCDPPAAADRSPTLARTNRQQLSSGDSCVLRLAPTTVSTPWVPPIRPVSRPALRQDSKQPVQPPSLDAEAFTEQVDELLAQIAPTTECERVVQGLAQNVKSLIRKHWPSASVVGVVSGEISRNTSFGVAVPEVDIIVNLRPQELAWPLQARLSRSGVSSNRTDVRKLQKSAIRVCTDVLVSDGGFKFRRSAFRGAEPKVTLMAPRALGLAESNIPIDFSVNAVIPLCNAGLLAELGRLEPRAKALALLVRRWAKDRGICHAAKGNLPPFAWTLMTTYFLQVGVESGPLLPALKQLKVPTIPSMPIWSSKDEMPTAMPNTGSESVGQLFAQFVKFYLETVNWKDEAVSVRFGRRSPPSPSLPLHPIRAPEGRFQTAPAIEDPFTPSHNVAECLTADGLDRMSEELQRAKVMIHSGGSLTELLNPWVPPDHRPSTQGGSHDEEDEKEERGTSEVISPSASSPDSPNTAESGEVFKRPPGLQLADVPPAEEPSAKPHPWNQHKQHSESSQSEEQEKVSAHSGAQKEIHESS